MEHAVMSKYNLWLHNAEDADLIDELMRIKDDEEQIHDRFYRELEFGTGGLRGVLGAGDNRMNIYNVRRATQGLANYLTGGKEGKGKYESASVAISFDSRIKSDLFAREAARVLAGNGIRVFIFPTLQPTPVLSYAVRQLYCQAGIMVTASHNPSKYNGYKCYGADGCQMTDYDAGEVTVCMRRVDIFRDVHVADYDEAIKSGLITVIDCDMVQRFLGEVMSQQVNPGICSKTPLKVVYTPLNGTGNVPVRAILERIGVSEVYVVPEQELPDGHFPTAPYPNPEIRQAFECALRLAETVQPDILLATDPDCDRMGIAVANGGDYTLMSGNEVGCLMLNYILSCRKENGTLPESPIVVKTIVTSDLVARIAEKYGCEMKEVLTGFKYIGEQIGLLEKDGEENRYIFGFEESYGYLSGSYVRDKDGVVASMLVCEMTAYYKSRGKGLLEVLEELYAEHGVYRHTLVNAEFEGAQGMEIMSRLMSSLRENRPQSVAGLSVEKFSDYERSVSVDITTGESRSIDLPKSNVLSFGLEGGAGLVVRPSGTEPKIKAYITATGRDRAEAENMAGKLDAAARELLKA